MRWGCTATSVYTVNVRKNGVPVGVLQPVPIGDCAAGDGRRHGPVLLADISATEIASLRDSDSPDRTHPMRIPFLTARWSHLVNVTWRVPPALLLPHLPDGVDLDVQEGDAFLSLVAFDFMDTRVGGVPWPGYRNFPELNLRFYVKHGDERAVVFIKEYVPRRLIAWMANGIYNEPYHYAPMRSAVNEDDASVHYELGVTVGGREHTVTATGRRPAIREADDSLAHYFKEHKWGFGRTHSGRTQRYEVEHPVWDSWPVESVTLDVDFALLYGEQWAFLAEQVPWVTLFAVGSEVKVFPAGGV